MARVPRKVLGVPLPVSQVYVELMETYIVTRVVSVQRVVRPQTIHQLHPTD